MFLGIKGGVNLNRDFGPFSSADIDELILKLQAANATMCLVGSRADGSNSGQNSPFTNPWVDIIGDNDATLVNFAETTASGWDSVTVPSGTEQMLKADGVDDYGSIANAPSLDPTGTEDFAISGGFKTDATLSTEFIFAKGLSSLSNLQYSLFYTSNGNIYARIGSGTLITFGTAVILADSIYSYCFKRIGGVLKFVLNGTTIYNVANSINLVSQPYFRMFGYPTSETTLGSLFNGHIGALAFFYNWATGLDETKVDVACDALGARYF